MTGPHIMVLTNLSATFILLIALLIFRFIYPKRKINFLPLLILISLLPLISILRAGSYESGDLSTHSMLSISFYEALLEKNFVPLWGGEMNATYGYPAFHFIYPLPYYIISILHFLGIPFIVSAKILIGSSFVLSGIFMYLFLKKEFKEIAAFTGALIYLFAPYHLIDMHFRVDIGETLAFVFIPLSLLAAKNFITNKTYKWFLVEILSLSLLIISHPAISLAGFGALALYVIVLVISEAKLKIKFISLQVVCFLFALLLTAFHWLPIMLEIKYTSAHNFVHTVSFLKIPALLFSPWRFGLLFQGPEGQLAFLIGYAQIIVIILGIIMLFKTKIKKPHKYLLAISLLIIFVCMIMTNKITNPLWMHIPLLSSFQFSYRLLGIGMFAVGVIGAVVAAYLKGRWFVIMICFIAIFSTILNWGNRRNAPWVTDEYLRNQIPNTISNGAGLAQAATLWSGSETPLAREAPKAHLEAIKGESEIIEIQRTNIHHTYLVNTQSKLLARENTLYFPGWNLYINGKPSKIIIITTSNPKGLIGFEIPKGLNKVELIFEDTYAVKLGKTISAWAALFLFLGILLRKRLNYFFQRSR